jgi:hypothetical protein
MHVQPFHLPLDGGGRELVTDIIRNNSIGLMVEIGCFLCGSTRQWLDASSVTVIGVDPWDGNWAPYVRRLAAEGSPMMEILEDAAETADIIQRHGNFLVALNNVRDHRDRFVPLRRRSPEALHYLHQRRIIPELIYIDAFKADDDLLSDARARRALRSRARPIHNARGSDMGPLLVGVSDLGRRQRHVAARGAR